MNPKRFLGLAIAVSAALASSAAFAATESPERVRSTTSATADSVTVNAYAAKPIPVSLTGNTSCLKMEKSNQSRYTPRVYKSRAPSVGPAPGWPEWFSE